MFKNYLFLLAAIGIFGAMAGRIQSPGHAAVSGDGTARFAEQASSTSSDDSAASEHSGQNGELVLDRHADGHFYADVEVNGVTIPMMVDTGASAVALSADDARRAGIATSIGMNQVVGEGAGGEVHGDIVTLDRVRLGDAEQSGVSAAVLNGGEQSLLGQSFLREFDTVEISGDQMRLR